MVSLSSYPGALGRGVPFLPVTMFMREITGRLKVLRNADKCCS